MLWLPVAATLAQTPPRDLDPVIVGRSNSDQPRGHVSAVAVRDGIAYCALTPFGLALFDLRDSARPHCLGRHEIPGGGWFNPSPRTVALYGTYACVAGTEISVFDVNNATDPRLVVRVNLENGPSARSIAVAGHCAYVAIEGSWARHGGLDVLDLSDPGRPQSLGWSRPMAFRMIS